MCPKRVTKRMRKKDKNSIKLMRPSLIGLLVVVILFVISLRAVAFLKNAELFKVKEIIEAPSLQFIKSRHLTRLKGKNIFDVDLKTVRKQLQSQYPQMSHLKIVRQFPNKIYVDAQKREPFAFIINKKKDILLDKEGVVLSFNVVQTLKLPAIDGVTLVQEVMAGKSLARREVAVALNIIKAIRSNEYLNLYDVDSIDVENLSKIDFYLSSGQKDVHQLRVIIDRDKVFQKIKKLGIVLSHGNLQIKDINYIDLRFKEPILGKKPG